MKNKIIYIILIIIIIIITTGCNYKNNNIMNKPKEVTNNLKIKIEDKECFIIAYSHLNDCDYRINSGHFKNEKEAVFYDCITANPEINKRLLKIKSQEN